MSTATPAHWLIDSELGVEPGCAESSVHDWRNVLMRFRERGERQ